MSLGIQSNHLQWNLFDAWLDHPPNHPHRRFFWIPSRVSETSTHFFPIFLPIMKLDEVLATHKNPGKNFCCRGSRRRIGRNCWKSWIPNWKKCVKSAWEHPTTGRFRAGGCSKIGDGWCEISSKIFLEINIVLLYGTALGNLEMISRSVFCLHFFYFQRSSLGFDAILNSTWENYIMRFFIPKIRARWLFRFNCT